MIKPPQTRTWIDEDGNYCTRHPSGVITKQTPEERKVAIQEKLSKIEKDLDSIPLE